MAEARWTRIMTDVDNDLYERLGDRWYDAHDDPVALLRAESRLRNPWIAADLRASFGARPCRVLDVGCGGGFLANYLATQGHRVVGLDAASNCLAVAAAHDRTGTVVYARGDATCLPLSSRSFDVVCALDLLEHVEAPEQVVAEAARVLVPGGRFYFHTFNRTWLAWFIVIKGVEWFVRNTPPRMHVLRLFVTPKELTSMCRSAGLEVQEILGSRPQLRRGFLRMLATGRVDDDLGFRFTRSQRLGYTGVAVKLPD